MKIKMLTVLMILVFGSIGIGSYGQTRRAKPAPTPAPQAAPQPSPTPEQPQPTVIEMTDAERKDLEVQLTRAETQLQISELGRTVGVRPTDDIKKLPAEIAAIYEKAVRDDKLAYSVMTHAFNTYPDKPSQSNVRLLLLQAAQNQLIIEQNKRIIQLLQEIAKQRK